jgi:hypothetical protein
MRLTHDGIPVNVMLVPLVDATAVPEVRTLAPITGVPLIVGLVIVGLVKVVDVKVAPVMVGLVSVLLVRVCVVIRSTSVEVLDGSVSVLLEATAAASICV